MRARLPLALVLAGSLLAAMTLGTSAATSPALRPDRDLIRAACAVPHDWLLRTWRGYRPDRSGQIQLLPKPPDFIGSGLPHVGPWPYLQNVPILWFGPGYVQPAGRVARPVTLTDIAPTQAELLRFGFDAPDGTPMSEALVPRDERSVPPRLIVTLVWDAGGRDVLSTWPNDWPTLRSLIPKGAWYDRATVGTSPSSTAQDHVNIGTGAYPKDAGIVAHHMRLGDRIVPPFAHGANLMVLPTLSDLYDRAMGGRSLVGEVATVSIHLGMIGHGSMWGGGDRDQLVLREQPGAETVGAEGLNWNVPPGFAGYYRFPPYVQDLPPLSRYFRTADAADGRVDGLWRGNEIDQQKGGFDTPARLPYQTRVIEDMVRREGYGKDDVPDLLFINYKLIDEVGHIWSMNSLEMKDSVRSSPRSPVNVAA